VKARSVNRDVIFRQLNTHVADKKHFYFIKRSPLQFVLLPIHNVWQVIADRCVETDIYRSWPPKSI